MILKPFLSLLHSRKFLLLVLDTTVSLVLHFTANIPNVEFIIGAIQPVFVAIIIAISVEDAAEKSAGS